MLDPDLPHRSADVLILPRSGGPVGAISLATLLRENGIRAPAPARKRNSENRLCRQAGPYVIFLGRTGISSGVVACKDMATGEQTRLEPRRHRLPH